jgi:non-ribosomal peptide synthetase component F
MAQIADDRWRDSHADLPLDHEGPTDVAFEQFDDVWVERPIVDRFNQVVARYGDKTAVVDEITRLTYRELQRASFHLACRIEALVPAGQPVGILLPNNALFPLAALACLAVGRPYVPIDPQYPRTRIDQIRQEAGLAAMIINRIEGQVFDGAGSLPYLDIGTSLDGADEQVPAVATSGGPAVILYTSGSTGQPKGICNDQRAILQRVAQATNSCHLNANDRFYLLSTPGTIAGVRETFAVPRPAAVVLPHFDRVQLHGGADHLPMVRTATLESRRHTAADRLRPTRHEV